MCQEHVLVPIPDWLWDADDGRGYSLARMFDPGHPEYGVDAEGRRCLALDCCIVPAIEALWARRIVTVSSGCGHGEGYGSITLRKVADGA